MNVRLNYYINFAIDAAYLKHSADWLKSHPSISDNDKIIDELIYRKLMAASNQCLEQAVNGYKLMLEDREKGKSELQTVTSEQIGKK